MRLALLVDFDDTAADRNVAELLLRRFYPNGWERLRQAFLAREITLRHYQEQGFRAMGARPEEMQAYVRAHASLRPGFDRLVRYSASRGIPLAVVTNGLDFYARALLAPYLALGVRLIAVETRFTPRGLEFYYPFARPACHGFGNCKCAVVEHYRARGHPVVYVGDSALTDLCPALYADFRLARHRLLAYCRERLVPHLEFVDFHSLVEALRSGDLERALKGGSR